MDRKALSSKISILLLGDALVLMLVTVIGFATHGTAGTAGFRMLTTYIPLLAAWLLISPHLKVYDRESVADYHQLWRPFWAMVLAAPMAAWLRGLWLNAPILPIFVVILGGVSALSILAWRGLFAFTFARMTK